MQRRLAYLGLFLGLFFFYLAACNGDTRCFFDYNCPQGQYCVGGTCQDTPPPGVEVPKEITPEAGPEPTPESTPEPMPESTPEPAPEPTPEGPQSCQAHSDCTREPNKTCYDKLCVPGYMEFSFSAGHPIINLQAAATACTSNANCQPWQFCETRASPVRCYPKLDNNAQAKGRIGSDSYFLDGYATSTVQSIDGKNYLVTYVTGDVSEKLQRILEIHIPLDNVQIGQFEIKPDGAKAFLFNDYIEFSPTRRVLAAEAIRGDIQLTLAGKTLGNTIAGSANLIFQAR